MSTGHDGFGPRASIDGCPRVTVGGVPVHCVGHAWENHPTVGSTHAGYLAQGAPHVSIGGRAVGRVGDPITCGDTVAQGCKNVTVGNCGGEDFSRETIFENLTDPKDKLLLCLEEIALAEAGKKTTAEDTRGWKYLAAMFDKWFSGKGNNNALSNPTPFWVDWNWIMEFQRARNHYDYFVSHPDMGENSSNIYNILSQKQIGSFLARDGFLGDSRLPFDYTALPWNEWLDRAFNYRRVSGIISTDGLQAALATFSFRALAKGYTDPNDDGRHTITLMDCGVFAYDTFHFNDEDDFFYWDCPGKTFLPFSFPNEEQHVRAPDFREFRRRSGFGNDFVVISQMHAVENFSGMRYVYP